MILPNLLIVYPFGGLNTRRAHADRITSRAKFVPDIKRVVGTRHPLYSKLATLRVRHAFQKHIEFCCKKSANIA